MDEPLLTETDGHVRVLTLHRPEVRNAMDATLIRSLVDALRAADADEDVRCIVLTGSDPAFTAGLDLKAIAAGTLTVGETSEHDTNPWRTMGELRTPVVGAINGVAITGGLELALRCDLLVASEHARFADTHARVGIHPGGGLTVLLPQSVGMRRAREMSFTGDFLAADEAQRLGLVNHVVPHDQLMPTALGIAHTIAEADPDVLRAIRRTYDDVAGMPQREALALEEQRMREWSVDVAGFEERRRAVTQRGRAQQG